MRNIVDKLTLIILIIISVLIVSIIVKIYFYYENIENIENIEKYNIAVKIPIVIIAYNNLTFVKSFVNQIKKFVNPIIILDNKSDYPKLLDYYTEIQNELKEKIEIRFLPENYGHEVYLLLKDTLPDIYILSDPDLGLNDNMPEFFSVDFLELSNKYEKYKIGSALTIDDENMVGVNYDIERGYWIDQIENDTYVLYNAPIDTTFCLINNSYNTGDKYSAIRVAGNYSVKHFPWYKDYIKNNFPQDEIDSYLQNNISTSVGTYKQ